MSEPAKIIINGTEYDADALTLEQKVLINHVSDLDKKVAAAGFQLDQLRVAREAFIGLLNKSLASPDSNV